MKKLMIAAAIVCAAALTQAAVVNWGASKIQAASGDPAMVKDNLVMLFYTEAGVGSTAIENAIKAGKAGNIDAETKGMSALSGKGSVTAHDLTIDALDTSKAYDFYVVAFNGKTEAAATKYALMSSLNNEYSTMKEKFVVMSDFSSASWQSIPEPTSGLLLLIGVAGLALRRRRA